MQSRLFFRLRDYKQSRPKPFRLETAYETNTHTDKNTHTRSSGQMEALRAVMLASLELHPTSVSLASLFSRYLNVTCDCQQSARSILHLRQSHTFYALTNEIPLNALCVREQKTEARSARLPPSLRKEHSSQVQRGICSHTRHFVIEP